MKTFPLGLHINHGADCASNQADPLAWEETCDCEFKDLKNRVVWLNDQISDWNEVWPDIGPREAKAMYEAVVLIVKESQPHICDLLCQSVKKTGEEWVHHDLCIRMRPLVEDE